MMTSNLGTTKIYTRQSWNMNDQTVYEDVFHAKANLLVYSSS